MVLIPSKAMTNDDATSNGSRKSNKLQRLLKKKMKNVSERILPSLDVNWWHIIKLLLMGILMGGVATILAFRSLARKVEPYVTSTSSSGSSPSENGHVYDRDGMDRFHYHVLVALMSPSDYMLSAISLSLIVICSSILIIAFRKYLWQEAPKKTMGSSTTGDNRRSLLILYMSMITVQAGIQIGRMVYLWVLSPSLLSVDLYNVIVYPAVGSIVCTTLLYPILAWLISNREEAKEETEEKGNYVNIDFETTKMSVV